MDDESLSSSTATASKSSGLENAVFIRIRVTDVNVEKVLQFDKDELIWEVKQKCLAAIPKVQ